MSFNKRKHLGTDLGYNSSTLRRGGSLRPAALISTQKYEWYMQNALNTTPTVLAYDTGNLDAKLDISNPALANKPTASTIGTKVSYASDGIDDYLYKSENDFMRSLPMDGDRSF